MPTSAWLRPWRVAMIAGGALLLGVVGVSMVVEGLLLVMPLPTSAAGRAWRTWALTALSTGLVAGLVGGVVCLTRDVPLLYAALLGSAAGAAGLALGALAGLVVSLDGYRREVHPA